MHLSNLARAVFISSVSLVASPAFSQGEECVDVENDIARLQCFDSAFDAVGKPVLDREEALIALFDLVEYRDHDTMLVLGARPGTCEIEAVLKYVSIWPRGERKPYVIRSYADLSKVEKVEGFGKQEEKHYGAKLIYERGAVGQWIRMTGPFVEPKERAELLDESNMRVDMKYSGRDARFYILIKDYFPDASKVQSALEDAVAACKKS